MPGLLMGNPAFAGEHLPTFQIVHFEVSPSKGKQEDIKYGP
jgi:hypothetical protein